MINQQNNPQTPTQPSAPVTKAGGKQINTTAILGIIAMIAVIVVVVAYALGYLDFLIPSGQTQQEEEQEEEQEKQPLPPIGISVNAPSGKNSGDTVVIEIVATGAEQLFGFQFDLSYDPSILSYVSNEEGPFLNNNGADTTFCVDPNTGTAGTLKNYACTRLKSGSTAVGVTGTGALAKITFTASSSGTSPLTLTNVKLADTDADKIDADVTNGQIVIS